MRKHDTQTVLPLITTERIRRAAQMSKAILANLAAQEVTRETAGIEGFFQITENLYRRLTELLENREG